MSLLSIPIFQVDAFTDVPFKGNPAAVCPLNHWLDDSLLQSIAEENNLSETAFFVPYEDGFQLRWFTPSTEIDLCGHATLATAHVIFNYLTKEFSGTSINFYTRSGKLTTTLQPQDQITLNFPAANFKQVAGIPELSIALSGDPEFFFEGADFYLAVFRKEEEIFSLDPDFMQLKSLPKKLIYITAPGNQVDFVSRVFGPAVGINEDPVTGAAHCAFTPYWSDRLQKKRLEARQLSRRTGKIFCEDLGDRVALTGKAITYLTGTILINT